MEIRIADIMSSKLVSVKPDSTVLDAVNKMIKAGIGNVLVINEGKLLGILTEKDVIIKIVSKRVDAKITLVKTIMTKKVITANSSMTIQEAARKMIDKGIRRIPIVEKGKVIGLVTSTDLLRVQPGLIDVLIEKYRYGMHHL